MTSRQNGTREGRAPVGGLGTPSRMGADMGEGAGGGREMRIRLQEGGRSQKPCSSLPGPAGQLEG